jgi:hypothetical protein
VVKPFISNLFPSLTAHIYYILVDSLKNSSVITPSINPRVLNPSFLNSPFIHPCKQQQILYVPIACGEHYENNYSLPPNIALLRKEQLEKDEQQINIDLKDKFMLKEKTLLSPYSFISGDQWNLPISYSNFVSNVSLSNYNFSKLLTLYNRQSYYRHVLSSVYDPLLLPYHKLFFDHKYVSKKNNNNNQNDLKKKVSSAGVEKLILFDSKKKEMEKEVEMEEDKYEVRNILLKNSNKNDDGFDKLMKRIVKKKRKKAPLTNPVKKIIEGN